MQKPKLTTADFRRILDAGHDKFMSAKRLPPDSSDARVYLLLMGLKSIVTSMNLELPFEIEDLDTEKPDIGGLDEIG